MRAIVVGLLSATAVVSAVAPRGVARRAGVPVGAGRARPAASSVGRAGPARVVKGWARLLAGRVGAPLRRVARRPPDERADTRLGAAVLIGGAAVLVGGVAPGMAAGVVAWGVPGWAARRRAGDARRAVVLALPDVVDLLLVAARAGLTVPLAVDAVATRLGPRDPFAAGLGEVRRQVGLGVRWGDALGALHALGEPVRALVAVLTAAERDGAPLGAPLAAVVEDARLARRRAAEQEARRLPVQLLFPLVTCILPAFGLLTVVPVLAGTLSSLSL